jgi:hypothetical protein
VTRSFTKYVVGALLAFAPYAHAQPSPPAAPQPPAQQEVAPTPRVKLTLEQEHIVKELIKDTKIKPAEISARVSVGDALPADAQPQPVPAEIGQRVPQIKAHRLVYTTDRILIVDPKDNKVADVIEVK